MKLIPSKITPSHILFLGVGVVIPVLVPQVFVMVSNLVKPGSVQEEASQ